MDQEPLVRILLHHRAKLTGYIWSLVRDVHVTDDVFQDVCVKAIAKRTEINDADHLLAWSRKVARDLAVDAMRHAAKRPAMLDASVLDLIEHDWAAENTADISDTTEALRLCLAELTDNNRRIVELRYIQGMRGVDVAKHLNRKTDTVYKALARIHTTLSECIDRRLSAEVADA